MITVVAVHGNGGGAFRFSLLPRPLAPDVELRAVTLPGFEGRMLPPGDPTMETYTTALADELAEIGTSGSGSDGPRVVLGHGIGGSIALDTLGRHPDVAEALILHAPVGADLDSRWFPRLMSTTPVRSAIQWGISSWGVRKGLGRLLLRGAPPEYVDRFFAEYRRCESFQPMFDLLDADWFTGLSPVDVPSVLLWGDRDRVLKSGQAEAFERLLPSARTVIEPGWGHFPMIDEPADYAERIATIARELVGGA